MLKKIALAAAIILSAAAYSPILRAESANPPLSIIAPSDELHQAVLDAMGEDASKAQAAIETLRDVGQPGLDAYLQTYEELVQSNMTHDVPRPDSAFVPLRAKADQIAMQKDAVHSRLFWYTDLDLAKAQAQKENKPILSLHLLGKLSDDLSCANSRFFRTTLDPNVLVSDYLRKNFILHWQSERPVPVITIDFGDGRKITRTLTGNSIHYILDPQGRIVDAIPGLYGPAAFLRTLHTAEAEAKTLAPLNDAAYTAALAKFHADQTAAIDKQFAADLKQLHLPEANVDFSTLTDLEWKQIAALHVDDAQLDLAAVGAIRAKIPAAVAMRLTMSKMAAEDPMMRLVQNIEGNISIDTVKNEYLFHEKISRLLSQPRGLRTPHPYDVADLNAYVYTNLFQTPADDPWLGLAQPDIYTAIDNGGLTEVAAK